MTDLLAAALEYAAAGIFVFPARVSIVDGRKKVSPIDHWREVSTTNLGQVREWFGGGRAWTTASVCIDCGRSQLVVIDPDEGEGKNGLENWAKVRAEHDVPETPCVAFTPGGGQHWYYREHPRRVVGIDSTGKVATDVDVRGLGGFVLAWPSVDTRGAYGRIDLLALKSAPVVPDVVIERMTAKATSAPTVPATVPGTEPPTAPTDFWLAMAPPRAFTKAQAKEFCVAPLEAFRAMRTPDDRGFNQRLNEVACIWSHFVPAFMTMAQAEAEIYKAAVENRSVEYQGEAAVRATIRSGLNQQRDPWKAERVEEPTAPSTVPAAEPVLRRGSFAGVRDRKRVEPRFMHRADGQNLLYPGKDSYLYAETESGKSWLAALAVTQCINDGVPVMVVDFEEGDELEYGNRLLDLGMDEAKISDPRRFRYLMVDGRATPEILAEAEDMGALVVIYEGMSVAYDVYGLQVKENDSATAFRRTLVKPHLVAGRAVLTTDHVVKDRESRGRYAIGGVMKLNAASGGAFLLMNVEGLAPGKRGASNLYVTKDRPGGVKRHSVPAGEKFDPQVKRVGTLIVDDTRSYVSFLDVSILPPSEAEVAAPVTTLPTLVLAAIDEIRTAGLEPNGKALRAQVDARAVDVDDEIHRLKVRGLVQETKGKHGARVFDLVVPIEGDEE